MEQSLSQSERAMLYQLNAKVEKILSMLSSKKADNIHSDYLGLPEAAAFISRSKSTLYGLVNRREIPHSKTGKRLCFARADLIAFIESNRRKTNAEILNDEENSMIDLHKKKSK